MPERETVSGRAPAMSTTCTSDHRVRRRSASATARGSSMDSTAANSIECSAVAFTRAKPARS